MDKHHKSDKRRTRRTFSPEFKAGAVADNFQPTSTMSPRRTDPPTPLRAAIESVFATAKNRRGPYGVAAELGAMLEPCLDELELMIDADHAGEAEPLLKRIVTGSCRVIARIDDSNARFYPLCSRAVMLWGAAWARIEPRNRKKLATMVRTRVQKDVSPIADHIVEAFSAALGVEGLHVLRKGYEAELDSLPAPADDGRSARSKEAWSRFHERYRVIAPLKRVADCLREVDEFIRLCVLNGHADRAGIAIGRRLNEAGRHEEALEWVERAVADDQERDPEKPCDEPYGAAMVRSLALRSLGRIGEAVEVLWEEFGRRPGMALLADIEAFVATHDSAATDAGRAGESRRRRAIETASRHPDIHVALRFLHEADALLDAAKLLAARTDELDGHEYETLVSLARAFERVAPRASWHLYRALLNAILADGRRTAYRHAARYLVRMRTLAPVARKATEQKSLDATLATEHRFKRSFWEAVADEGGQQEEPERSQKWRDTKCVTLEAQNASQHPSASARTASHESSASSCRCESMQRNAAPCDAVRNRGNGRSRIRTYEG